MLKHGYVKKEKGNEEKEMDGEEEMSKDEMMMKMCKQVDEMHKMMMDKKE